jgi:ribosomal protein S18 acetylase RimI-like enzyme
VDCFQQDTHESTLTEKSNMENGSKILTLKTAAIRDHLTFDLIEFNAFRRSEQGCALEFPMPSISVPFVAVPYFAVLEVILFRARRYFVMLGNRIVGLFAIEQKGNSLVISNLAVVPEARRHGVGTYILDQICRMATKQGMRGLRLRVLKKNIPAQLLYNRYGFRKRKESRLSLKLEKRL